jgi:hypothetical protein
VHRIANAAAVSVFALLLSACGGDGGNPATASYQDTQTRDLCAALPADADGSTDGLAEALRQDGGGDRELVDAVTRWERDSDLDAAAEALAVCEQLGFGR